MNRIVNIATFIILAAYCFMVIVVVYDLSISNLHLKGMPYKSEIFTGMSLLVLLLALLRAKRRWQGIKDMSRYSRFIFSAPISKKLRTHRAVVTSIEILSWLAVIYVCTLVTQLEPLYAYPMIGVLTIICLESLVFNVLLFKGGSGFKIGLDNTIIAYFDREMHLYYYTGLQRVELYQSDLIYLGYREDLNMTIDATAIDKADRVAFRNALVSVLESKNIYVDDSFRNWQ